MSLRARILVGGLAITVVLAVAAAVIIRATEAHLIERVDGQLDPRALSFEECGAEAALSQPGPEDDSTTELGLSDGTEAEVAECSEAVATGPVPPGEEPGTGGGGIGTGEEPGTYEHTESIVGTYEQAESVGLPPEGSAPEDPQQDLLTFFTVMRVTSSGVEPLSLPEIDGPPGTPNIDQAEAVEAADTGEAFTVGSQDSDVRWRARAVFEEDTDSLLIVAQSLGDVDAIVDQLVVIEVVATLAILAALVLVAWWVDRHGIRPVKRMTATASAIAAGDLSPRVPEVGPGTEAGQLGRALNQMLGRLEQAFDERSRSESRLRQFVADASHELRTPVTTIHGYSELYEGGGLEDSDELSEAMRRTREEAVRMGILVDDMLLLARLDQGPELALTQMDLAALVRDAGRDARAVDPDRVVVTSSDGPLDVLGDSDRLRQVLANLVGNALVHTPSSAELRIRAHRDGDVAIVEVADRGPGMPPEVTDHAFERFFRADPSRSRHRGGSGLGLAIVQACVDAHGGEVHLDSRPGEGTTARVTLPVAPLPADSQVALGEV